MAAQAATLAVAALALMPLSGYIFGNLTLTHIGDTTAIAAHTVTAFLILVAGVLAATHDHGFMMWLRRESRVIGLVASLFMLVFISLPSFSFYEGNIETQPGIVNGIFFQHLLPKFHQFLHFFGFRSRFCGGMLFA